MAHTDVTDADLEHEFASYYYHFRLYFYIDH